MDVTGRIRRWTLGRPRVLLIDAPGSQNLRWQLEAELDRRDWPLALSPADTDLVLVLGRPGPRLAAATDLLWSQVPQPRHRQEIHGDGSLPAQLDTAREALLDAASRVEPEQPGVQAQLPTNATGHEPGTVDRQGGHGGGHHAEHTDHVDAGHGGHEGHDMHHGGDVAGLPMADTAPDRDGLTLDTLRVTLGPVLPGWPTGLLLNATLQGDVMTGVELAWADAGEESDGNSVGEVGPEALALDRLAAFLLVAGWPLAAAAARRSRAGLSDAGTDPQRATSARRGAARVAARVRRSRSLRWSVQGVGNTHTGRNVAPVGGDVWDRVRDWCDVAAGANPAHTASSRSLLDVSAELEGSELAAARIILASTGLEPPVGRLVAESTDV